MFGRRDRSIVLNNRVVEEIKEFGYSVVENVFQVEEELTEVIRDFSRIVPPDDVINWATIIMVSRTDDLRGDKMEKWIYRDVDDRKGV